MTRTETMATENPDGWDANFDDEQKEVYYLLFDRELE